MHANQHPGTQEHHTYSRKEGYQAAEYSPLEYPKVVGYEKDGVTPITANTPEEAEQFTEAAQPLETPAAETPKAE